MAAHRHDCKSGAACFMRDSHPKFEVFDECLTRGCEGGDIDYAIETNGHVLFAEFKRPGQPLSIGQRILYEAITVASPRFTVIVVYSTPDMQNPSAYQLIREGKLEKKSVACDLASLKTFWREWWRAAEGER